ncbi:competence type IV pilus minor pilin ComGG [Priestia koreensis]|uniref:competence type IV pilus minor pilin ComGG n=1 Tax=Priestia koreensis TaxID=284581 RepID=UPI0030181C5A
MKAFFILPTTMILAFLTIFLVTQQLQPYISEKLFYKEAEEQYKLNHLLENGLTSLKRDITSQSFSPQHTYRFQNGTVSYTATADEFSYSIEITVKSAHNKQYRAWAKLCKIDGVVMEWKEKHRSE